MPHERARSSEHCLLLVVALVACACGCDAPASAPSAASKAPGAVYDAGAVFRRESPTVGHTFQVTNTTDRPVAIRGETHSCDCTTVELTPCLLQPGASTPLRMAVDLQNIYRDDPLTCLVQTDHPAFPIWLYQLQLITLPNARVEPESIDLGTIPLGTRAADLPPQGSAEIWLENYERIAERERERERDASVGDSGSLGVTVRAVGPPTVDIVHGDVRRTRQRFAVALDDSSLATPGSFALPIMLGVPERPPASVVVSWHVSSPISITPSPVHFGLVGPADAPHTSRVVVRSVDGRPFRVLEAASDHAALTVGESGNSGDAATEHELDLTLRTPPESPGRALAGTVRVRTDRDNDLTLSIPWSAFLRTNAGSADGPKAALPPDPERSLP